MPGPVSSAESSVRSDAWRPPSDQLEKGDGLWRARSRAQISYPDSANDAFLAIEDGSYWFRHRMDCLLAIMERFPPGGDLYDIGGGNGYVTARLDAAGYPSVLVEPGSGAANAVRRGVTRVVQATLQDAAFASGVLPAAGAFDVVEHIADDVGFLAALRGMLRPGGRFYCTVPAEPTLWSDEDERAGHFRRYRPAALARALRRAGFEVEFISPFFTWLVPAVFAFRSLPSKFRLRQAAAEEWSPAKAARDHALSPPLARLVAPIHAWELAQLKAARPLPFGTSLLAVARVAG